MNVIHVVFIAVTCLLSGSSSHKTRDINIILRTCGGKADGCPLSRHYDDPDYYSNVLRLMSGGIVQIVFQDLNDLLPQVNLTAGCATSLRDVRSRLREGKEEAFQLIDASAKFPAAFLERTVTSYGDYDQCLAVSSHPHQSPGPGQAAVTATLTAPVATPVTAAGDSEHVSSWVGKYCMVDTIPESPDNMISDGKIHLERQFMFAHTPVFHGLCFPSPCTADDVRNLVTAVLEPFPFRVEGDVSCDTWNSISFTTRAMNITKGQAISLLILVTVAGLIAAGTAIELLPLVPQAGRIEPLIPAKFKKVAISFSLISNIHELFRTEKSGNHMIYVDWIKFVIICASVFAHISCCLETPLGFFVMTHHSNLEAIVTNTFTQVFFNDGGLSTVTFLSGFASYHQFAPLIKNNNLRYGMSIFDRWLRFVPSVMAITCLDFIWPLLFSGPFYTRVGNYMTEKCSNNWWYNALFIGIYKPALDLCAPHTYYTSIDFNMFILGLVALYLLVNHRKAGIAFCIAGIMIGNVLLYYFAWLHKVTPSVLMRNISSQQVVNYLDVVQMSLYSFFCSYFAGILLADMLKHGLRVQLSSRKDHIKWIIAVYVTLTLAETSPALHNTFNLLPQSLVPLHIVLTRLAFTSAVTLLVIYLSSSSSSSGEKDLNNNSKDISRRKKDDGDSCQADQSGDLDKDSAGDRMTSPASSSSSSALPSDSDGMARLRDLSQAMKDFFTSRLMIVLTRLSFSIFMVNYFFIRTDFFTSRVTFDASIYSLIKRVISYSFFITMSAFVFQVAFVSPAARLRKMLNYRITKN